jgi:formate--tetrahydrofolate ligase
LSVRPIAEVGAGLGLLPEELEPYGRFAAKIPTTALDRLALAQDGRLVCVTAMTPTKFGGGKTTTAISLADGLGRLGAHPVLCLREPSLGPVFGIKGGGTVRPRAGDAEGVDQPPVHGRHLRDRRGEQPPRRDGRRSSPARQSGRARLAVGHLAFDGAPVTAEELGAAGAMAALLTEALKPNLVQTLEGRPALDHCGPFANIAHGNSSLLADQLGLKLGDYVVTESGFGADMGFEKFVDIVSRLGGLSPSAVVLVVTIQALKHHGGDPHGGLAALERGAENLAANLAIVRECGLSTIAAVNRFPGDTDEELALARSLSLDAGAAAAEVDEGYERRGAGAIELAQAVADASERAGQVRRLYALDDPIAAKLEAVATRVYAPPASSSRRRPRHRSRSPSASGSDGCRFASRRRTCPSRTTPRCSGLRTDTRCRCASSTPTRAPGGSWPSAERCRRYPGFPPSPRRSGSTSTATGRSRASDR